MKKVKITHPEAGEATVFEISLPHHIARGWRLVEEPEEPAKPREVPSEKPRRRRVADRNAERNEES